MSEGTVQPGPGVVYTETVIHLAPEAFAADAPYQIAIVELDSGGRITGRVEGDAATVGDRVEYVDSRNGVPFFRKA